MNVYVTFSRIHRTAGIPAGSLCLFFLLYVSSLRSPTCPSKLLSVVGTQKTNSPLRSEIASYLPAVFIFSYCHTRGDAAKSQIPATPQSSDGVPVRRDWRRSVATHLTGPPATLPAVFAFSSCRTSLVCVLRRVLRSFLA